jgi:hypothetical protein
MKKLFSFSLTIILFFLINITSVDAANSSGNEEWYTETQLSALLESQISYEGIYANTFTFPDVTSKIKNDVELGAAITGSTCHVWFDMKGFQSYDSSNFEIIDNHNIKFIGEDDSITYIIQVIGTVNGGTGFLCQGSIDLSNQVITLQIQPDITNFYESCAAYDLTCQANVVSKGVGQIPELASNANETVDHVNTIAGGFPAMQFGLALFFIGIVLAIKKWLS